MDESKLQEDIERLQKALCDKDDQIAQSLIFTDTLMEKKNIEIEELRKKLDDVTCSLIFASKTIERKNDEIELLKSHFEKVEIDHAVAYRELNYKLGNAKQIVEVKNEELNRLKAKLYDQITTES